MLKLDKYLYILIILSISAYLPVLLNGFTYYSDGNYILANPLIQKLSIDNLVLIFTSYFDGHYHPLTLISFSFNYFFSGESAFGYQLTNLVLNTFNSLLVFIFIEKLIKNRTYAFAIALLFALHPLHVESVARITERKDTLYSLFFLISCIYYLNFIHTQKIKQFYFVIIFFFLALLSKGQSVMLPFVLILSSWFILGWAGMKKQLKFTLPLFLLSIIFGVLNLKAQQYTGYFLDTSEIPLFNNIIIGGYVLVNYIFRLFIPFQLSPHYPYPFNIYEAAPIYYYLYLLIYPVITLIIILFRKNRLFLFGIIFYLINIILMIRLIPVAENVMPDRYNYMASLGFIIVIIYLLNRFCNKKMIPIVYFISALFFIKTFTQNSVWKTGITVWETAYKYYPSDSEVNQNLGDQYFRANEVDVALNHINKAIELDSANLLAFISRANIYNYLNNQTKRQLDLNYIINYPAITSKDLANQSLIYASLLKNTEALQKNELAIDKNPYNSKLYFNKAVILFKQNNYNEALIAIDKCISLKPSYLGNAELLKFKIALFSNKLNLAKEALEESKKYLKNNTPEIKEAELTYIKHYNKQ